MLLFGQSWKSAEPGQIDSALLFTPPVRWHWQGKLKPAFKVACHGNVWLQFLIQVTWKLSRAFTLYVELGRAKNINSEEMNVTTDLGWPLTWTLILLVKPSISDESHRKNVVFSGRKCVTVVVSAYFHLSEIVLKDWNHPWICRSSFQSVASVGGKRKHFLSTRDLPKRWKCRPLKFYERAVGTHLSGSIINSCVQTDNAECW